MFLVDTGDAMSPELSRETRTKLCALIMMLSSYQVMPGTWTLGTSLGPALRAGTVTLPYRLLCPGCLQILGVPLQGKDAPSW